MLFRSRACSSDGWIVAAGEQVVKGAAGGVGDGGNEGGLLHGGVPEDLDVQGGEDLGLKAFGDFVDPAGQRRQQVNQVQVGDWRGLLSQGLALGLGGFEFVVQVSEVGVDAGPQRGRGGVVGGRWARWPGLGRGCPGTF